MNFATCSSARRLQNGSSSLDERCLDERQLCRPVRHLPRRWMACMDLRRREVGGVRRRGRFRRRAMTSRLRPPSRWRRRGSASSPSSPRATPTRAARTARPFAPRRLLRGQGRAQRRRDGRRDLRPPRRQADRPRGGRSALRRLRAALRPLHLPRARQERDGAPPAPREHGAGAARPGTEMAYEERRHAERLALVERCLNELPRSSAPCWSSTTSTTAAPASPRARR